MHFYYCPSSVGHSECYSLLLQLQSAHLYRFCRNCNISWFCCPFCTQCCKTKHDICVHMGSYHIILLNNRSAVDIFDSFNFDTLSDLRLLQNTIQTSLIQDEEYLTIHREETAENMLTERGEGINNSYHNEVCLPYFLFKVFTNAT